MQLNVEKLGNLVKIMAFFKHNNIPQDKWGSILGTDGAFCSLAQDEPDDSQTHDCVPWASTVVCAEPLRVWTVLFLNVAGHYM
jgi:hypothetical protein